MAFIHFIRKQWRRRHRAFPGKPTTPFGSYLWYLDGNIPHSKPVYGRKPWNAHFRMEQYYKLRGGRS